MIGMRSVFLHMFLLTWFVITCGPAHSNTNDIPIWSNMVSSCVDLLSTQSTEVLGVHGDIQVAPDPEVKSLTLTSVSDTDNALKIIATSVGGPIFLCIVEKQKGFHPDEIDELTASWRKNQFEIDKSHSFHLVNFDHPSTINPVLVRCLDEGRITVVTAFIFDDGQFKVGALDKLLEKYPNPCTYSGS